MGTTTITPSEQRKLQVKAMICSFQGGDAGTRDPGVLAEEIDEVYEEYLQQILQENKALKTERDRQDREIADGVAMRAIETAEGTIG